MRNVLSKSLVSVARKNPKIILITGDHGYSLFDEYRRKCPKQYINAGVAEQNMIGLAAGLAKSGFFPIVYALSAFVPIRTLEQIKLDICYENLPVILLGDGAGFVYSHLGSSHQSMEDIAVTRVIPNLSVLSPADRYEMKGVFSLAIEQKSPVYIRIGKSDLPTIHKKKINLILGETLLIRESKSKIVFVATGSMVTIALKIANESIDACVLSIPCIKPLKSNQLLEKIRESEIIVTFEEHSVIGGLGGAIAELCSEYNSRILLRIGTNDSFSDKCGSYQYAQKEHMVDPESIKIKIKKFLKSN